MKAVQRMFIAWRRFLFVPTAFLQHGFNFDLRVILNFADSAWCSPRSQPAAGRI
jgi:hypothetical protein